MVMLLRIVLLFVALCWIGGAFSEKAPVTHAEEYLSSEDGSGPPPWPRP